MGWVYLVQNGDLYKIGRTDKLQRRLKQLQPCTVIQTLETDRDRNLEVELHRAFKSVRVPQTEYFRLSEQQLIKARQALGWVPLVERPKDPPVVVSDSIVDDDNTQSDWEKALEDFAVTKWQLRFLALGALALLALIQGIEKLATHTPFLVDLPLALVELVLLATLALIGSIALLFFIHYVVQLVSLILAKQGPVSWI